MTVQELIDKLTPIVDKQRVIEMVIEGDQFDINEVNSEDEDSVGLIN